MKYPILALLIFSIFFSSCSDTKKEQTKKIKTTVFNESPVDSAYSSLRPKTQYREIDTSIPTTLEMEAGTQIFIPQNSFIDKDGNPVKGKVKIEVVEAFKLSDFITAGLTTLSNDKLLLSNGMLFIDATSDGNSLQLQEGKQLTVSMPTMGNMSKEGFQMFTGDGTNWKVDSSMLEEDYLIPLPLELLYPEGNDWFDYLWVYDGKSCKYDTTLISLTNPKYENTIIATQDFKTRFVDLLLMNSFMSWTKGTNWEKEKMYYFNYGWNCSRFELDYTMTNIYYQNYEKPLWYLDSIAKATYSSYLNDKKVQLAGYIVDSVTLESYIQQPLIYFPNSTKKELKTIKDYGVDLNAKNAHQKLKDLGVSKQEISEILEYNLRREALIQELKKQKQAIEDKKAMDKLYEKTIFSLKKLGWINCDRFYDDPKAGKAEIMLANTSDTKLNFIDFSLVIPDMNVRLMSFKRNNGLYSFTKEEGVYTKLPIGKDAIVVGVSVQNDSIFYASKKIKIEDGISLDMNMKHISSQNLKDSLNIALGKAM
ncbi:hypothetical protein [Bernardetia sp.]|uniref:hypothetical protein n=1 Tax=Bernardetia sp. TaxID=1937974 RepID=UPI0025BF6AD5|nr:hypothetical protein [Bernardetia sp.]